MSVHTLAHYQHFSFLGLIELLAVSWKEMIHPIHLSREEHPMYEATENQDTDWLKEFAFDEPAPTILTIGKSPKELRVLRKEALSAIQQSHSALTETILEIARATRNRSLDSETKAALNKDFDARFDRLIRELKNNETALAECDTALSQFFSRRLSDNRTPQQPICV